MDSICPYGPINVDLCLQGANRVRGRLGSMDSFERNSFASDKVHFLLLDDTVAGMVQSDVLCGDRIRFLWTHTVF